MFSIPGLIVCLSLIQYLSIQGIPIPAPKIFRPNSTTICDTREAIDLTASLIILNEKFSYVKKLFDDNYLDKLVIALNEGKKSMSDFSLITCPSVVSGENKMVLKNVRELSKWLTRNSKNFLTAEFRFNCKTFSSYLATTYNVAQNLKAAMYVVKRFVNNFIQSYEIASTEYINNFDYVEKSIDDIVLVIEIILGQSKVEDLALDLEDVDMDRVVCYLKKYENYAAAWK